MIKSYWFLGSRLTILADAASTDGRYDLIEGHFAPRTGTPLHRHNRYQEQVYVLEGEFTVRVGERKILLPAGQSIVIPIGVPHAIAASGDPPAKALTIASPSAFAHLIAAVGTPSELGAAPPDLELLQRVMMEVGDEILQPPVIPAGV